MAGRFLDPLELEYIDGREWRLIAGFRYHLGSPTGERVVRVPPDFITDFASIPQFLWNILPPTGEYGKAAVLHDYLYRYRLIWEHKPAPLIQLSEHPNNNLGGSAAIPAILVGEPGPRTALISAYTCSRAEADGVLKEGMQVLGVSKLTTFTIWSAVRAFGWIPWRRYRKTPIPSPTDLSNS